MKVLLTTLNARYTHSSLALRYLEKYCRNGKWQLEVAEYSINEPLEKICAEIYKIGADIIGFSCYIWNINLILRIADTLKKVKPEVTIILGGPEVTFNCQELINKNPYLDYIVKGEGEKTLKELLEFLCGGKGKLEEIKGLVYREQDGKAKENEERELICNLNTLPAPYEDRDLLDLSHKVIYYETSRGCPFNCSYCLSSTITGVRNFPLEKVKKELKFLIDNGVKKVKFVDRTFNASKDRALELFRFLVANQNKTSFHFEIAADLLDDEMLDFLVEVPDGLFQFEIGIQSTYEKTVFAIDRKMDFQQVAANVKRLREAGNIHLHLDLIAGLPDEDYHTFKKSFNDVYALNPHMLQLGFLKMLKGSKIRKEAAKYSYKYTTYPPYEVLENEFISYEELLNLKAVENVLDKYHNSGVFERSIKYILVNHYNSAFRFFKDLADYFVCKGYDRRPQSRKALYNILFEFYRKQINDNLDIFCEFLKYDLLKNNRGSKLPPWASNHKEPGFKDRRYRFLTREDNVKKYLPHYNGLSPGNILKKVRFDVFKVDILAQDLKEVKEEPKVIMFDYQEKRSHDITADF